MLNYLSFALSASAIGLWKLRGRQFDAIFAYEPSPITVGLPAAVMRAVKRAPLAFWVLDLWPETLQAIGVVRSPLLLRVVGQLVAFIYKRCDLILAQSKSFIPQIKKYAGEARRVEYFPSWAEAVFDQKETVPASEIPLRPGSFNVMFAGNIGDAQDFPAILAAAESLKSHTHIRWLIVGDGRMAGWVAGEIKRRQLQDCVLMVGRYPLERMPAFFKHANALLVSLKDEPIFSMTIPGKLQSYLAAGIPVAAMLNGEGADLVVRSRAGVACAAGDSVRLAAAVLALSQMSEAERAVMGKNGLDISAQEFGRDKLMDALEVWLSQLQLPSVPSSTRGGGA
jgi:glycosyltransferase involved in cell wall biosynthesis